MSEMYYFSNKFSKIAKRWGLCSPASLNLRFWWPKVAWFGQIVVFQTDYDEIELKENQLWRHRYYFTEKCHQTNIARFSILDSFQQNFWLHQCFYIFKVFWL